VKKKKVDNDDDSPCSVFGFPKDADRLITWLHRIPQENLNIDNITDYLGVCERHFL
jgi:hypothetical protein